MGTVSQTGAALRKSVAPARIVAVRGSKSSRRADRLAGEEPMEIRAGAFGQEPVPVAVTMRTPGHDFELAAGFLFTEGLVPASGILKVSYCDNLPPRSGRDTPGLDVEQAYNVVTVRTARPFDSDVARRNFYATSSCGICGKASLDEIEVHCSVIPEGPSVARSVITALPDALRKAQKTFEATGGLHAAGLFSPQGDVVGVREDVGRHNALDKLVGKELLAGRSIAGNVVMVSGRSSFEIVQKAAVAGAPVVAAVSAPSSLAVDAAERFNITLIGFLRGDGFNVYTHPERVDLEG